MTTMRVVPTFDPLKNSHLGFGLTFEATTVQQLPLERSKKTLRHCVVVGITDRSHRRHDAGFAAALAEGVAGVLAAAIRMMNHRRGPALCDRHVQRRQNQLGAQVRLHRPANHASRVHVEHHRQTQATRPDGDIPHIRHPQPIGPIAVELPLHQIHLVPRSRIAQRRHHVAPQRRAPKTCRSHQPGDALAAHPDPMVIGEFGMNVRRAVDAFGAPVDRLDLARQRQVRPISLTHRSIQPRIESASRNLQQSAHDPDRVGGLVHLHEPEERFEVPLSVANQAAAFERISRSSFNLRTSRRNRDSSSRSAVVNPPSPLPASRLPCRTHSAIVQGVGPYSFDKDLAVLPLCAKSTICRLNSGVYRTLLAAMLNTSITNSGVSTKPGQLQSIARPLEELWSESVAVAHFCGAVVKRLKLAMPDAFAAGLLHRVGHLYILVQLARQDASQPRVTLSKGLVDEWHPAIAKAVLKNWHVNDAVCEAVGMQADVLAVRSGPPTLTDVLVAGMRLANRMMNSRDTSSFSSGGVLARLNLSIEECRGLIGEAEAEVRALARALHS